MPFMSNGKRDYKKELKWEKQSRPKRVKERAERNKARAIVARKVGKSAIAGKDVDHKQPLSKGGKTTPGNLRVRSKHANRSYKRNANGSMK